jgi:ech hydrogenase subunit D
MDFMLQNLREIELAELAENVYRMKQDGFRFVTITCTDTGPSLDLLYQFDQGYALHNLRVTVPKGKTVPSMSNIYFAAVLVENEIQDLFGLKFFNLAIDFQGRFLLSEHAPKAPFAKNVGMGIDLRVQAATTPVAPLSAQPQDMSHA